MMTTHNKKYIYKMESGRCRLAMPCKKSGKITHLGSFDTIEEAQIERNRVVLKYPERFKMPNPKGVGLQKVSGKYQSYLNIKGPTKDYRIHIGTYDTLEEAYKARVKFVRETIADLTSNSL